MAERIGGPSAGSALTISTVDRTGTIFAGGTISACACSSLSPAIAITQNRAAIQKWSANPNGFDLPFLRHRNSDLEQ